MRDDRIDKRFDRADKIPLVCKRCAEVERIRSTGKLGDVIPENEREGACV